jgi:hypothetical protein
VWTLCVEYRADGNEYAARLGLSDECVAFSIEQLLERATAGDREAGLELFVTLHTEWGQHGPVGRHPAWDAVFRYLAPQVCAGEEQPPR